MMMIDLGSKSPGWIDGERTKKKKEGMYIVYVSLTDRESNQL